jgi:hypothetical protein
MVRLCDMPEYRDIKNVNPFSSGGRESAEQAKNHFANTFTSAAILKSTDGVNWTTQSQTEEQKKEAEAASKRRDLVGDGTQKVCVCVMLLVRPCPEFFLRASCAHDPAQPVGGWQRR